jgi:hypothetical protein
MKVMRHGWREREPRHQGYQTRGRWKRESGALPNVPPFNRRWPKVGGNSDKARGTLNPLCNAQMDDPVLFCSDRCKEDARVIKRVRQMVKEVGFTKFVGEILAE